MRTADRIGTLLGGALITAALGFTLAAGGPPAAPAGMTDKEAAHSVARCRAVLADVRVMASAIRTLDDALDERVGAMRAAVDETERLEAMQEAIETMVSQRRDLRQMMKQTHQEVVGHLMGHLSIDDPSLRRETLTACPLTRAMVPIQHMSGVSETPLDLEY